MVVNIYHRTSLKGHARKQSLVHVCEHKYITEAIKNAQRTTFGEEPGKYVASKASPETGWTNVARLKHQGSTYHNNRRQVLLDGRNSESRHHHREMSILASRGVPRDGHLSHRILP
jgi:hypothetical protein